MTINSLFEIGDIIYSKIDANIGKLIPLIVEKISIVIESSSVYYISYQVSNTKKFHNSEYLENELCSYSAAKILAENYLNEQISEIEEQIEDL